MDKRYDQKNVPFPKNEQNIQEKTDNAESTTQFSSQFIRILVINGKKVKLRRPFKISL